MIDSMRIKNFKCFLDQEIPLRRLTVLAGANGGGKSTVIQSILLMRQTIDRLKHQTIKEGDPVKIKLNEDYNLNLGNSKDVACVRTDSDVIELVVAFDDRTLPFQYTASKKEPELFIYSVPDRRLRQAFDSGDAIRSLLSDSFHYLVAERVGPRDVQFISDHVWATAGYAGEYTGYAMYKSADRKVDKLKCIYNDVIGKNDLFKKQVEAWMDLILPGIEILPEIFDSTNSARVGLRRNASETDYLKPPNMGFGITYVLPIVVSGLIAGKNSTMIVENPEAHLHPMGQSKIGQFLAQMANAGIQVIIETHSEHIINGIRLAILKNHINHADVIINFFNQERKSPSPGVESITVNEQAELSNWPRGFLDQEEIDLGEMFKLKRQKK